jgi:hypothetical protein
VPSGSVGSASEVMEKEASLVGRPSLERDNAILTMSKNARRFMSEGKMTSSQCGMKLIRAFSLEVQGAGVFLPRIRRPSE